MRKSANIQLMVFDQISISIKIKTHLFDQILIEMDTKILRQRFIIEYYYGHFKEKNFRVTKCSTTNSDWHIFQPHTVFDFTYTENLLKCIKKPHII